MQECPKCGFSQPVDRYCANCGLDIEGFRPKPDSILKKLTKNTGLHITIVVLVISVLSTFIYFEQKKKLLEHLNLNPQTNPSLRLNESISKLPTTDLNRNAAAPPEEKPPLPADTLAAAPAQLPIENTNAAKLTKTEVAATPDTGTNPAQDTARKKIVVTFAEISSSVLQQLANEGQIISDSAQRRAFTNTKLESVHKIKDKDPDFKILPGGKTQKLSLNDPIPFDFSHLNSKNEDVGLSFEITTVSNNATEVELSLNGSLHLKDESQATLTHHEINAMFTFSPKTTLALVGYLPHQAIRAEDQDLFSNTPLVIYDSLAFLNGVTEFVIFIQAK